MPVYQDKQRGTWYVTYQVKDKATGAFKTRKKRGFNTKREATAYERENRYVDGGEPSNKTFNQVAEEFLGTKTVSPQTLENNRTLIRLHFPYKDYLITDITKPLIAEWLQDLRNDTKHKTRYKNAIIILVRSVLFYAEEVYEIETPVKSIKSLETPKKERQQKQEMHIWELEEFNKFYNALDSYVFKTFFEFLYWTGCRKGEARALHKSEVNLEAKTVTFKYTVDDDRYGVKEGTKTDSGRRTISIDDTLVEHLKPLMESEGEFVFYDKEPLRLAAINTAWTNGIKKSGVPWLRIHDLRHSHASYLIGHGIPVTMVSKRLGHSNPSITYKVYAHIIDKNEEELVDLLAKNHR